MPRFEGTSDAGGVQDALDKAVQEALKSADHPDATVSYLVATIAGSTGGISGRKKITVTIYAEVH